MRLTPRVQGAYHEELGYGAGVELVFANPWRAWPATTGPGKQLRTYAVASLGCGWAGRCVACP